MFFWSVTFRRIRITLPESQESFEFDFKMNNSRDVCLASSKSGMLKCWHVWLRNAVLLFKKVLFNGCNYFWCLFDFEVGLDASWEPHGPAGRAKAIWPRLPQIGIGNLACAVSAKLGPISQKKPRATPASWSPTDWFGFPEKQDWPELQIGARVDLQDGWPDCFRSASPETFPDEWIVH